MKLFLPVLFAAALLADGPGRIVSKQAETDFDLTADPQAKHWKVAQPVLLENDAYGKPVAGHRGEVRSRWTRNHLYILFTAPYRELYSNAQPSTTSETDKLWEHDVAEVFIGSNMDQIHRYKEFQVSPQGEWVDLDIDRQNPKPSGGVGWNSYFKVKARIDERRKIWYGEMRIPMSALETRTPAPGNELRVNFYRFQGGPAIRNKLAWQPTNSTSFHVPEAFGRLVLSR